MCDCSKNSNSITYSICDEKSNSKKSSDMDILISDLNSMNALLNTKIGFLKNINDKLVGVYCRCEESVLDKNLKPIIDDPDKGSLSKLQNLRHEYNNLLEELQNEINILSRTI